MVKTFYTDNIIEKVKCAVFYVYLFNFITYFQFILSTQNCVRFVSWNGVNVCVLLDELSDNNIY